MDRAAIFDAQGSSVWASTPGFSVRGDLFPPCVILVHNAWTWTCGLGVSIIVDSADTTLIQVKPEELKTVVTAFADKGDAQGVKQVQSTGIHIGGERYVVLKADERSLYGKKVRDLFDGTTI